MQCKVMQQQQQQQQYTSKKQCLFVQCEIALLFGGSVATYTHMCFDLMFLVYH